MNMVTPPVIDPAIELESIKADKPTEQAQRVAYYLEQSPVSTGKEIDASCDVGCVTKVLSDMARSGYGIAKGWRWVPCVGGNKRRLVRTYSLTHWPHQQPDLFTPP